MLGIRIHHRLTTIFITISYISVVRALLHARESRISLVYTSVINSILIVIRDFNFTSYAFFSYIIILFIRVILVLMGRGLNSDHLITSLIAIPGYLTFSPKVSLIFGVSLKPALLLPAPEVALLFYYFSASFSFYLLTRERRLVLNPLFIIIAVIIGGNYDTTTIFY